MGRGQGAGITPLLFQSIHLPDGPWEEIWFGSKSFALPRTIWKLKHSFKQAPIQKSQCRFSNQIMCTKCVLKCVDEGKVWMKMHLFMKIAFRRLYVRENCTLKCVYQDKCTLKC